MTADTAAPALAATARNVMDRIRYMVLGTIDEDGCARTSPVYFVPHRYRDLYWVSSPTSHHSHNLKRDNRLSAVIFDSTVPPGPDQQAVYVAGTAREVQPAALAKHLPRAFPICSCGDPRGKHIDGKGACQAEHKQSSNGYQEFRPCGCQMYDGPEPLPGHYAPEIQG
jgi:hypothetical protein